MPPCVHSCTLYKVAANKIFHWLKSASTPLDKKLIRYYLLNTLPPNSRQALLSHVLELSQVFDIKCLFIELLGDNTTQTLDLMKSGFLYVDEVFHLYRSLATSGLKNLKILKFVCDVRAFSDRRYISDINSTFHMFLGHMQRLVSVTLCGVCDCVMLATLGSNCNSLQYLDVSNSPRVDNEGIGKLLLKDEVCLKNITYLASNPLPQTNKCCETLTYISVANTEAGVASVVLILRCLKDVKSIGDSISDGTLVQVLQTLQDCDLPTVLTKVCEPRILPQHASLLTSACPNLKSLITEESSVPFITLLQPLQHLTIDLKLRGNPEAIHNMLQISGATLTHLSLQANINCPLDMAYLMSTTPGLQHLEACLYLREECTLPGWESLQSADVGVTTCKGIIELLTHTPVLRRISITLEPEPYMETWKDLNDSVLSQILSSGGLSVVEELLVSKCGITYNGIKCLLVHCPKLQLLGFLINWPSVTEDNLFTIREEIRSNNWCLELLVSSVGPLRTVT